MKKAMIAMSGGVDSAVAALLMKEAGYDCCGVTMRLYREAAFQPENKKSCCSDEDEDDAAFVCYQLGIPHETQCYSRQFEQQVIRRFIREYEMGYTPNPCIECNRYLKFDELMNYARSSGYDVLVTGHYARITREESTGRRQLRKAVDETKDQSYVLYMLTQEQLKYLCFPLGELLKTDAREIAAQHGLANAKKHESQDICFIPDGDYGAFLERRTGKTYPPGDIVDENGKIVGQHHGLIRYTIGQRRGLHVAMGERIYVTKKDIAHNTLSVGTEKELFHHGLVAGNFNWLSIPTPEGEITVTARTRYHQTDKPATARPLPDGSVKILFEEGQRAVTPGQAVVLYDGDLVLGGGEICEVLE